MKKAFIKTTIVPEPWYDYILSNTKSTHLFTPHTCAPTASEIYSSNSQTHPDQPFFYIYLFSSPNIIYCCSCFYHRSIPFSFCLFPSVCFNPKQVGERPNRGVKWCLTLISFVDWTPALQRWAPSRQLGWSFQGWCGGIMVIILWHREPVANDSPVDSLPHG